MKTYDTTEDFIFIVYKNNNKFGRYEMGFVNDNRINFLDVRNIPSKKARQCWYRADFHDTVEPLRKLLEKV